MFFVTSQPMHAFSNKVWREKCYPQFRAMNYVGDSDFAEDLDINVVVQGILTIDSHILIL